MTDNTGILQSDLFRDKVLRGEIEIDPWGDGNLMTITPDTPQEIAEDYLQKHIDLNTEKKDDFEKFDFSKFTDTEKPSVYETELEAAEKDKSKTTPVWADIIEDPKYGLSKQEKKKLVDSNFTLPHIYKEGEGPDKALSWFTVLDGMYDNYIQFPAGFTLGALGWKDQKDIEQIEEAMRGDKTHMFNPFKDLTLEQLDNARTEIIARQEGKKEFKDKVFPTSNEIFQNRIRDQLGIELPMDAIIELKSGIKYGKGTMAGGLLVDFLPFAVAFSAMSYKSALKSIDSFSEYVTKNEKILKGLSNEKKIAKYLEEKYPVDGGFIAKTKRWWLGGRVNTGIRVLEARKFREQAKLLDDDILLADKKLKTAQANFDNGKINKQKLIEVTDELRDVKMQKHKLTMKGVNPVFREDAAMELAFAGGAAVVADTFGEQYEFLGGLGGGVSYGLAGNLVYGYAKAGYTGLANLLDSVSQMARTKGAFIDEWNVRRFKPDELRKVKIWDKELGIHRELKSVELSQLKYLAEQISKGGDETINYFKENVKNYTNLIDRFTPVIGEENIHKLHQEFAAVTMLGPLLIAKDADIYKGTLTNIFSIANPQFIEDLSGAQAMIDTLAHVANDFINLSKGPNPLNKEFIAFQEGVLSFVQKAQIEQVNSFSALTQSVDNISKMLSDTKHPVWDNPQLVNKHIKNITDLQEYLAKDKVLMESGVLQKSGLIDSLNNVLNTKKSMDVNAGQMQSSINKIMESALPDHVKLEHVMRHVAKTTQTLERHHKDLAGKRYTALYEKYADVKFDASDMFNNMWKIFGDTSELRGLKVFWKNHSKAPAQFKKVKEVYDEAAGRVIREEIFPKLIKTDGLTEAEKSLEYTKFINTNKNILAQQLDVKPSMLDNITIFESLKRQGKDISLNLNLRELNSLKSALTSTYFHMQKARDPLAYEFKKLLVEVTGEVSEDSVGRTITKKGALDIVADNYNTAYPNLKADIKDVSNYYKYVVADRYYSDAAASKFGNSFTEYSQLGKAIDEGEVFRAEGKQLKTDAYDWFNFNSIKRNTGLFKQQIEQHIGVWNGSRYIVDTGSEMALAYQAAVTRMIDDEIIKIAKKNKYKFQSGQLILTKEGEVALPSGKPLNLFDEVRQLADDLSIDVGQGVPKWKLYDAERLMNSEGNLKKLVQEDTKLLKQYQNIESDLAAQLKTEGELIKTRLQQNSKALLAEHAKTSGGLQDTTSFVERFIGKEGSVSTGIDFSNLKNQIVNIEKKMGEKEFNNTVRDIIGNYINQKFLVQSTGKNASGESIKKFDFMGMKQFLDTNETVLNQVLDTEHVGLLKGITEISEIFSKGIQDTTTNNFAFSFPRGYTIGGIISRVYAFSRQVIGARYLLSEMTLVAMRKRKGDLLKELLKDKNSAQIVYDILERGAIDDKLNKRFANTLKTAYMETAILEPEPEKLEGVSAFDIPVPTPFLPDVPDIPVGKAVTLATETIPEKIKTIAGGVPEWERRNVEGQMQGLGLE